MLKRRWVTSKYRQLRTACGQHGDNIWLPRADPCLTFFYERELFRHIKSCLFRNVFQHLTNVQTKISSIMFHQSFGRVSKVNMLKELCLNCYFDSAVLCMDTIVIRVVYLLIVGK